VENKDIARAPLRVHLNYYLVTGKVHLIPAAGTATRMGGIPKFLLPTNQPGNSPAVDENGKTETLLDYHVGLGLRSCDRTIIASRPENMMALQKYLIPGKVEAMCMETSTMSETISRMVGVVRAEIYFVTMPDTYFLGSDFELNRIMPNQTSGELVSLAAWDIVPKQIGSVGQVQLDKHGIVVKHQDKSKDSSLPLVWGAIAFQSEAEQFIDPQTPHIGYLIDSARRAGHDVVGMRFSGQYLDCGTPQGYLDLVTGKSARTSLTPRQ